VNTDLAWLDEQADNDMLSVATVRKIVKALGRPSLPRVLSTVTASHKIGFLPRFWRAACEAGSIDGAWKDDDARCRVHSHDGGL
jgi:hypothetical protein